MTKPKRRAKRKSTKTVYRYVFQSSKTGRFVSRAYAERYPHLTFRHEQRLSR